MADDCANPLLLGWLKEWMDQAQERNSKGYTVYKKAFQSMRECRDTFQHPSEAQKLNGLGPKLCERLTDRLKTYCSEHGLPMPEKRRPASSKRSTTNDDDDAARPARKARKVKEYVPTPRSGAWALVMALATLDQKGKRALSKEELTEVAQPFCDASFSVPSDTTKFYTAWSSMKTLETKELVCTRGHPIKRYYLSDEGWELGIRLQATNNGNQQPRTHNAVSEPTGAENKSNGNRSKTSQSVPGGSEDDEVEIVDLSPSPEPNRHREPAPDNQSQSTPNSLVACSIVDVDAGTIPLPPGSFAVRLVLDSREVRSKTDRDYISEGLMKQGIAPLTRTLPLGDFLWIAQVKPEYVSRLRMSNRGDEEQGNDEIVLDHIMERKRLDDLISSIKDGRFSEQKFRLKKSGIKNVTYIVEDFSISAEKSDKHGEAVESVIASMQVVSDIFVKQTTKLDNTIQYLARFTKALQTQYHDKTIQVIPTRRIEMDQYLALLEDLRKDSPGTTFGTTFSAFSSLCNKNDSMTLRDIYLKMLLCIRGVTSDKAIEISKIWPTPSAFIEAYEAQGDQGKRESMVSDQLGNTIPRKKVGKTLSAKIADVWGQ